MSLKSKQDKQQTAVKQTITITVSKEGRVVTDWWHPVINALLMKIEDPEKVPEQRWCG